MTTPLIRKVVRLIRPVLVDGGRGAVAPAVVVVHNHRSDQCRCKLLVRLLLLLLLVLLVHIRAAMALLMMMPNHHLCRRQTPESSTATATCRGSEQPNSYCNYFVMRRQRRHQVSSSLWSLLRDANNGAGGAARKSRKGRAATASSRTTTTSTKRIPLETPAPLEPSSSSSIGDQHQSAEDDWIMDDDSPQSTESQPQDSYRTSTTTTTTTLERLQEATDRLLRQPPSSSTAQVAAVWNELEYLLSLWPRHARMAGPRAGVNAEHLLKRSVQELEWMLRAEKSHNNPLQQSSSSSSRQAQQPHPYIRLSTKHYTYLLDTWARVGGLAAAERAETIHAGLVREFLKQQPQSSLAPPPPPTVESYNTLLWAWRTARVPERAPVEAERILEEMRTMNIVPDSVTITTVLELYSQKLSFLWSSSPPGDDLTTRVTEIVQRCEALVQEEEEIIHAPSPDGSRFYRRINCFGWAALQTVHARSRLPDAAAKAEAILQRLLPKQQRNATTTRTTTIPNDFNNNPESESDWSFEQPHIANYNAVLNACSKNPTRTNIRRALHWLRRLEQQSPPSSPLPVDSSSSSMHVTVRPDRISYALVILTCARGGCVDPAERVLRRMEARARQERALQLQVSSVAALPKVTLEVESYNVVLLALSSLSSTKASPQRALALLQRMQKHGVKPNVRSWNAILNTLARASSSQRDGPSYVRQAERILERLSSPTSDVKPNEFTYAAVLSVYMRSGDPEAAPRADALVRRMEDLYEQGELASPPEMYHYTTLTNTYARSPDRVTAARRVLEILMHMWETATQKNRPSCRPNTRTYNSIFDCLIRAGELERAEELLFYMLGLYRRGDNTAAPDVYSFNCVIAAFTRSRRKDAGSRAESILDRLVEYSEEENPQVLPDARSFNLVLSYYAKSKAPDSSYRADYILNRMVNRFKDGQSHLLPSLYSFTSVIESYASASHPDAGTNADRLVRILRRLNDQYGARLELNTSFMNTVLFAWASCGADDAGSHVEVYLDEMEAAFEMGWLHLAPDTRSYGLALSAWSKSTARDKHRRALDILRRMQRQEEKGNRNVKVDEHARSLVINACGFSNARTDAGEEAFDIAVSLFDQIIAGPMQPMALSFGWFIQACGRIEGVPDEKKEAQIERAFMLCCEAGLVNDFILNRLRGAASDELFQKLLQPAIDSSQKSEAGRETMVSIAQLPADWKRNSVLKHKSVSNRPQH